MDRKKRFTEIYNTNEFKGKESLSGPGSDLVQTEIIRKEIPLLCKQLKVKKFIDICGDCTWVKHMWSDLLPEIDNYIGVDIVPRLIEKNNFLYSSDKINFLCLDIVDSLLPQGDLLLCRDILVHLSFDSINKFLKNFYNSNIKYLLVTTFLNRNNMDGVDGTIWYPLDLLSKPFNLPKPLILINEGCSECNGEYSDKHLALYTKEQLESWYKERTINGMVS
jgi:hypothetical protein